MTYPYRETGMVLINKKVNELSPEAINVCVTNINHKSLKERNIFFRLKVKYFISSLRKYLIDCKFKGRNKDFEFPPFTNYKHFWFALLEFHKAGWEHIMVDHTPFVPEFDGPNFSFKNAECFSGSSPKIEFSSKKEE